MCWNIICFQTLLRWSCILNSTVVKSQTCLYLPYMITVTLYGDCWVAIFVKHVILAEPIRMLELNNFFVWTMNNIKGTKVNQSLVQKWGIIKCWLACMYQFCTNESENSSTGFLSAIWQLNLMTFSYCFCYYFRSCLKGQKGCWRYYWFCEEWCKCLVLRDVSST